jgi:hypothetical protein
MDYTRNKRIKQVNERSLVVGVDIAKENQKEEIII